MSDVCACNGQHEKCEIISKLRERVARKDRTQERVKLIIEERDQLRAENAQWKELHARHAVMVIPGETDSADAYREIYFRMKSALERIAKPELNGIDGMVIVDMGAHHFFQYTARKALDDAAKKEG